jgi:hypothetical protein
MLCRQYSVKRFTSYRNESRSGSFDFYITVSIKEAYHDSVYTYRSNTLSFGNRKNGLKKFPHPGHGLQPVKEMRSRELVVITIE